MERGEKKGLFLSSSQYEAFSVIKNVGLHSTVNLEEAKRVLFQHINTEKRMAFKLEWNSRLAPLHTALNYRANIEVKMQI